MNPMNKVMIYDHVYIKIFVGVRIINPFIQVSSQNVKTIKYETYTQTLGNKSASQNIKWFYLEN